MRPALRQPLTALTAAAALLAVVGCSDKDGGADGRPKPKPAVVTAKIVTPNRGANDAPLTLARVSTKSGEILILEPDGSVSTMQLDSPQGRDAFAISEADLMALNANMSLDLRGLVGAVPKGPTAQQLALEEFATRTRPALPDLKKDTAIAPEDFLGSRVVALSPKRGNGGSDLVEVTANLREGVDADLAFSYATCALAGWAKANGATYARHIRTLQDKRDGKLLIGAAFTLSDSRPLGLRVMETNDTLRSCKDRGIPAA